MKSRPLLLVALACVMLAIAGFFLAWHMHATARDIEARQSKLAAQNASLKDRLRVLNAQTKTAADDSSNAQAAQKTNSGHKPEIDPAYLLALKLHEKRLQTTESQKKRFASMRVDNGIVYGPFFHIARLTPDQAAKLTDALSRRSETNADIDAVRQEQHGKLDDPVWDELRGRANDEAQSAAQTILDAGAYAQFQLYDRQIGAWTCAENFAAAMALSDKPVSLGQSRQLVEAICNASPSYQNGTAKPGFLSDVDWESVDADAQKILTPQQFEVFTKAWFQQGATPYQFAIRVGVASRWEQDYSKALDNATKPETPETE